MSKNKDVFLKVKVIPRARSNGVTLTSEGHLRVRLMTVAEKGKANTALVQWLSELLELPSSRMHIVKGRFSSHKILRISGLSSDALSGRINTFLAKGKS